MFAAALSLVASLALAAPARNAHLTTAESQVGDLKYSDAAKSLAKARLDRGNDRLTLLRILELTGEVEGSLGHEKQAIDAFRTLLFLDPTKSLGDEWGPKVRTPFYEARGWLGDHHPFSAQDAGALLEGGQVKSLSVALGEDPLKLFGVVRVHVVGAPEGAVPSARVAPGKVVIPVTPAPQLRWWAEVLGPNEEVLGGVGDEMAPLTAGSAPVAAAAAAPNLAPTSSPPPIAAVARTTEPESQYRPSAYGLMIGGVAGLAVGTVFGIQVHNAQSQLNGATRDSQGRIASLTQAQAYALDSTARTNGVVADLGFVAGGLALAAGVGLWFYGGQMAVAPTGNGVAVAAAF